MKSPMLGGGGVRESGQQTLSAVLWLQREQTLAFEQLPGDGAGPDVRIQVFRVADPGDTVQVALLSDGMRVASIGKQLRRSPSARFREADWHALAGRCAVRCAEPYSL
jgi:hypothetical protein